jgi:hypothetical protein
MIANSNSEKDFFKGLQADMFKKTIFAKADALVVFIPEGKEPPPEVKKVLDESGPQRFYPKDGGNLVKCPAVVENFDKNLFTIEKGGWDHEHCDNCGTTIDVGESYWVSETDEIIFICNGCYRKLQQKSFT